jgi:hypothetical protein
MVIRVRKANTQCMARVIPVEEDRHWSSAGRRAGRAASSPHQRDKMLPQDRRAVQNIARKIGLVMTTALGDSFRLGIEGGRTN